MPELESIKMDIALKEKEGQRVQQQSATHGRDTIQVDAPTVPTLCHTTPNSQTGLNEDR